MRERHDGWPPSTYCAHEPGVAKKMTHCTDIALVSVQFAFSVLFGDHPLQHRQGGCFPGMFSEHLALPDVTVLFSCLSRTETYTLNALIPP